MNQFGKNNLSCFYKIFVFHLLSSVVLLFFVFNFICIRSTIAESVHTQIGEVYIQNNHLYKRGDTNLESLTGSRLVGALYNASFDGRYVLYGGAKVVEGLLLPDPTLYVLDVQNGEITDINNLFSLKVIGGSFSPNSYNLALVNIYDRMLYIVDFGLRKIKKTVLLLNAQDLSFQPVWNVAGERVAIYQTGCIDRNIFNQSDERNLSGWLTVNIELPDKEINYGDISLVQKLSESPDFGQPFVQLESEESGAIAATCVDSPTEVGGDITLRLPYQNGEQYSVSQGYCSNGGSHRGFEVDFRTPSGTVLVATAPGIVIEGGG